MSMPQRRVLITGPFNQQAKKRIQSAGFEVLRCPANCACGDVLIMLAGVDAYILNGNEQVTAQMIDQAANLRLIVFPGVQPETYLDAGAMDALDRRGIPLETLDGSATNAVAELACALILSCLRRVPFLVRAVQDRDWPIYTGDELCGKVLGICGMGKIGCTVAERLSGFNLKRVLYYDVVRSERAERDLRAQRVSIDELFSESDAISIHMPLTSDTQGMVGDALLRRMKPSAVLVNTARPQIVDPHALRLVLEEWRIGCAAFDGYYLEGPGFSEQMERRDPYGLIEMHDRFFVTSHQGFNTQRALRESSDQAVDRVIAFFEAFDSQPRAA